MAASGKRVAFGRSAINNESDSTTSSSENEGHSYGSASALYPRLDHIDPKTPTPSYRQEHRVYSRRWFMLVSLCALNISNGMMWLTYAPIPNFTAAFYNISLNDVDWFSTSYFIVSLVVGFVSIIVLDTLGLKVSLYTGALVNVVGAVLRYVSTINPVVCSSLFPRAGFMVAMVGQILTAFAQPFLLYAPTKLANLWFGPKERAVCTSLATISNPLGLAITQLVAPYVVTEVTHLPTLLWIYCIPAGCAASLTLVFFWRGTPAIPPAASRDHESLPFLRGIRKTVTNINFWVLMATWGMGAGLFNAMLTLLPQVLCPFGYSDEQSGLWGALMIFCGLVGATIAGLIIDHTKKFKEIAAVSLALALLCLIWFYEIFYLGQQAPNVAVSLCLFGFFALPLIPACMELGVEVTYPVAEATSSGLLWSMAQICGIIMVTLGQVLQTDLSPSLLPQSKCSTSSGGSVQYHCVHNTTNSSLPWSDISTPQDLSHAITLFVVLVTLAFLLFVILFRPSYQRIADEKRMDFEASTYVHSPSKEY